MIFSSFVCWIAVPENTGRSQRVLYHNEYPSTATESIYSLVGNHSNKHHYEIKTIRIVKIADMQLISLV